MRLFTRKPKYEPGTEWLGGRAWSTDRAIVPFPGYYAVDGNDVLADVPLEWEVDETLPDFGRFVHAYPEGK